MPTSPTSTANPSSENSVNGVSVSAIAPNAPTTASGSDISTASGSTSDPNSITISMYIRISAIPSAMKISLNASPPSPPWPA